jgi:hypothetical protein
VPQLARDRVEEIHAPVLLEDLVVDGQRGGAVCVDVAEAASRLGFGTGPLHALRDALVDAPLEVEAELVVEGAAGAVAGLGKAEDAAHERRLLAAGRHVAGSAVRRSPTVSV